jgi:exodeoxyribonuclease-3
VASRQDRRSGRRRARAPDRGARGLNALKIATFNVNHVARRIRPLLAWLEKEAPDVVCLQETKVADAEFPIAPLRALGYGARWHGERSYNGVAILAKGCDPVETRRGLPGDDADEQPRYLEAAVRGVIVGCLYLPNGNPQPGPKFAYKLRWFERLLGHAQALWDTGHPVVLAGDYNVVPTDELDVYDPKSWKKNALFQPAPRAAWQRLLAQGWTDALRARYPDERVYTFWDYFRDHWPRNRGLRLDHLLLSASVAPRMLDAGVDAWVRGLPDASDHAPVWVTLAAPSKRRSKKS